VSTSTERTVVPFLDLTPVTSSVRLEVEAAWAAVLEGNGFIGGAAVSDFERSWADYCGSAYAVGVANGTDALHLTFRALGIGPGDEVIVPSNSFVATAEAVVLAGARPRFADVDPNSLLLTAETIEAAVTPKTRAVAVVHLYGQMPNMAAILTTTRRLGLLAVEDAAQAQGATWLGAKAGSMGDAGCFSFYPGKNLGAFGDAGCVVTNDPRVAEDMRSMRDHGRAAGGHHEHRLMGMNSRLDALQAIVLGAKLRHLDEWNRERRALVAKYRQLLDPGVARLVEGPPGGRGVHHLAVVRVREREAVRASLAEKGVATGIHYPTPCHRMGPYAEYADGALPEVERSAPEVLSLPIYPGMSLDQVAYVSRCVNGLSLSRRRGA
jgi:dTDP-4-amino-4,6-dideoxygalactose transaminase